MSSSIQTLEEQIVSTDELLREYEARHAAAPDDLALELSAIGLRERLSDLRAQLREERETGEKEVIEVRSKRKLVASGPAAMRRSVMAGKFEIERSKDGQYYFHLKAGNGEKILASERYKAKASAENGIESVKKNSPDDARYDRRQAADGQHHFVLKAANGEIIGTSERYTTTSAMEKGIDSVKANAPAAAVVDLSA